MHKVSWQAGRLDAAPSALAAALSKRLGRQVQARSPNWSDSLIVEGLHGSIGSHAQPKQIGRERERISKVMV